MYTSCTCSNAKLQVTLNAWDYSQSYPYRGDDPSDGDDLGSKFGDDSGNNAIGNKTKGPQFSYDIGASGMIEAHFTPMVTFGIVWNEKLQVANAAVSSSPLPRHSWAVDGAERGNAPEANRAVDRLRCRHIRPHVRRHQLPVRQRPVLLLWRRRRIQSFCPSLRSVVIRR